MVIYWKSGNAYRLDGYYQWSKSISIVWSVCTHTPNNEHSVAGFPIAAIKTEKTIIYDLKNSCIHHNWRCNLSMWLGFNSNREQHEKGLCGFHEWFSVPPMAPADWWEAKKERSLLNPEKTWWAALTNVWRLYSIFHWSWLVCRPSLLHYPGDLKSNFWNRNTWWYCFFYTYRILLTAQCAVTCRKYF